MTNKLVRKFLILIFIVTNQAIAAQSVETYRQLLQAIRETRAATAQRIETAVNQAKVREAWETGKLIDEHILLHKERADYGDYVIVRLAEDLESSQTELSLMLQFARGYQSIPEGNGLSWSHYRALLSLNDPKEREEVQKEAVRKNWTRDQLRAAVRRRVPQLESEKPLEAKPGKIGSYLVIDWKGKKVYDLGFSNFHEIKGKVPETNPAAEDLYTYEAQVEDVIDGDSVPRKAAQEMRAGPSKPICRNGLQSTLSGFG